MKMLLAALALLYPAGGGSLGIGIDVVPEAFSFAARRVDFVVDMRLTACTASRCLWDLGEGVQIAAYQLDDSLDIYRIEATLDERSSIDASSASRYQKACLAVVALVEHDATLEDLRVAAAAISSPPDGVSPPIRIDVPDRPIRLYGAPSPTHDDLRPIAKRCGATAV